MPPPQKCAKARKAAPDGQNSKWGGVILLGLFLAAPEAMWAQLVQPAAGVQWRDMMHAPKRPNYGTRYTWDTGSSSLVGAPEAADDIVREESGEEWWYSHCNLYDGNGEFIGFATAGYNTVSNWWPQDETGCFGTDVSLSSPEYPDEFETNEHRKGQLRAWVARYDVNGVQLWCRSYLVGTFYDVAQDADGSIVAVGEASAPRKATDTEETVTPLLYNPGVGSGTDVSHIDCTDSPDEGLPAYGKMEIKGYAVKVDLNGDLVWQNIYGSAPEVADGWGLDHRSRIKSLASMDLPNAQGSGFYVVMDAGGQMCMRIRGSDGHVVDRATIPPIAGNAMSAFSVQSIVFNGATHLLLAGAFYPSGHQGAFVAHIADGVADPFSITSSWTTADNAFNVYHLDDHFQHCSDAAFLNQNGTLGIIWPVLSNYVPTTTVASGRSIAELMVYRLTPGSANPEWSTNLGEVRAYDLQAAAIQTTDENVVVLSSSWPDDYNVGTPFGYGGLSSEIADCLEQFDHDWLNSLLYDYWLTDAFVTKLDVEDGTEIWRTKFDSEPGIEATCFPGDIRKQECMYKITETPDGGLVVSGNTSHNFDDYYLAKLYPDCQSTVEYDPVIAAAVMSSPARSYTVGTNETWNTDKNIHGTIIIPDGHQLNIAGSATIRFADSRLLAHPTRIIVQAGGRLSVGTNVTLTSLPGCNDQKALWDGIIVQGDMDYPLQEPLNASAQGSVSLRPCLIENARVAVSVGEDLLATNSMAVAQELASGGIVTADGTTFRNNVRDVVFSPFENHHGDYPNGLYGGEENKSRFRTCTFENTAQLNDPYQRPQAHATLFGVRGVRFQGCSFKGGVYPMLDENGNTVLTDQYMGQGIKSLNSTFAVEARCQPQQYGDPCTEEELVRNTFTTLWNGVHASTFGDMSRTFIVDRSDFVGCVRGIRMEGIQDAGITLNTFEVGDLPVGDLAVTPYGVYSDQCTGYEIEENAFGIGSHSSALKKVGLVIKDSGKNYNTFYNNTFDALHVGSLIEGGNASEDEITGLEIKCNDYGLTTKCDFDVALTGEAVKIQKTQGQALDIQDPNTYGNPAGNRFSLTHDPNPPELDDLEADWFVEDNASTTADYFHHTPIIGSRTLPTYRDALNLLPSDQGFSWPGKEDACPSHLIRRTRSENRMASSSADEDLSDSKDAYDAAKDDGETYSLLTYVSDPGHSSTQVRDALQSTAPKVSAEVWNAAFGRDPAMSAWHITQALLSNSPLQGEVLKRVIESGLPTFYLGLIASAQTGEANILSLLESGVAYHAGLKADALVDLGRSAFTDSLDLAGGLDSLKWWHEQLPADNHGAAVGAVLSVLGDMLGLYDLAEAYELAGEDPGLYGLVKRYASGWPTADAPTMAWVAALGEQRSVQGSAQANAWLEATGVAAVDEIILLPREERASSASAQHHSAPINWSDDALLEAFPNPSSGPTYLVYRTSGASGPCVLRVIDAKGELVRQFQEANGSGIIELSTEGWASGLYVVELRYDAAEALRIKLSVQR